MTTCHFCENVATTAILGRIGQVPEDVDKDKSGIYVIRFCDAHRPMAMWKGDHATDLRG